MLTIFIYRKCNNYTMKCIVCGKPATVYLTYQETVNEEGRKVVVNFKKGALAFCNEECMYDRLSTVFRNHNLIVFEDITDEKEG